MDRKPIPKPIKIALVGLMATGAFLGPGQTASALSLTDRFAGGACYSRNYSADHLAKHPRQLVAQIWFSADTAQETSQTLLALRFGFTLRDGRRYGSTVYCEANAQCVTEGDGGRMRFTDRGENLRMSIIDYLVVEGADFSPDLSQSDDTVFLLYPSDPANCDW